MRTGKPLPKWPLKATSPERRTERSRKRRAKLAEAGIREVRGIYAPAEHHAAIKLWLATLMIPLIVALH